jgi:hypothetical protein
MSGRRDRRTSSALNNFGPFEDFAAQRFSGAPEVIFD